MIYKEENCNLFSVSDDYYLAHCISADFGMGKGIVVEFNKRFDMKNNLQTCFGDYLEEFKKNKYESDCLMMGRVFNLITKERYWQKPTYKTMRGALEMMKELAIQNNVKKIAMPTIGCGLDRLQWNKVSEIIKEVFNDTNIEILVCKAKKMRA